MGPSGNAVPQTNSKVRQKREIDEHTLVLLRISIRIMPFVLAIVPFRVLFLWIFLLMRNGHLDIHVFLG